MARVTLYGVWLLDWEDQTLLSIFTTPEAAETELARLTLLNEPTGQYQSRAIGWGDLNLTIIEHELDKPVDVEVRSWDGAS